MFILTIIIGAIRCTALITASYVKCTKGCCDWLTVWSRKNEPGQGLLASWFRLGFRPNLQTILRQSNDYLRTMTKLTTSLR